MTTENNSGGSDTGSTFTPDEEAYFASGGEGSIPVDGDAGGSPPAGGAAPGAAAPAGGAAAADGAAAAAPKGDTTVPLARFLEEKKSRKGLETQLAELRGKFSIIEKLQGAGAAADQQQQQPAAPPSAEEDIFGAVRHVGETVTQLQKRLDDDKAANEASTAQTEFVNNYRNDAATFETKTPDFKAAYNFLLNERAKELMAVGYDNPADPTLTPDEQRIAAQTLHNALIADEFAIAEMGFAKKKSPAELLYGLAKQRGYKPAAAGGEPAAGVEPAAGGKGAETLDRIERGQAGHKSLAPVGGASGDPGMTGERLLAMPQDEFAAWCEKNPAAAKRIMGG